MDNCLVCGENIEGKAGVIEYTFEGKKMVFCTLACLRIFQQFPEIYLSPEENQISTLEDSKA